MFVAPPSHEHHRVESAATIGARITQAGYLAQRKLTWEAYVGCRGLCIAGYSLDCKREKGVTMARNVDDIIRKLSGAQRKKVEARAAQLIAEEMKLRKIQKTRKPT